MPAALNKPIRFLSVPDRCLQSMEVLCLTLKAGTDVKTTEEPLKILVADRNRHVREFIRRELQPGGHTIQLAGTAAEVLQFIQQSPTFDLIILDPSLPGLDHRDTVKKIIEVTRLTSTVLHALQDDINRSAFLGPNVSLIEKKGNSVELIKYLAQRISTRPRHYSGQMS